MRLYGRLAINGIRNNGKLYYPFLGTCVGIIAIFYIVAALSVDPAIKLIKGGATLQILLKFATIVVSIFAALFLFFTNSFVVKRRTKEFGLYNILGMNKRNIAKIMFWETLISYIGSLVAGTLLGILLSKFAEVGVAKIVEDTVGLDFFVPFFAIKWTAIVFLGIFTLIFANSLRFVTFSNPTQMVKSEQLGEKPPKANFLIGIIGFVILAAAYYLANYNLKNNPIGAIGNFLVAIIMVIIATYLIFIAGTVMICKILGKNKNYYYNKKHFVSLSSMVFRMKRSGAGLATICILITMVLVMMSSATSLYAGQTLVIDLEYPLGNIIGINVYENIDRSNGDEGFPDDAEHYLEIMNENFDEAIASGEDYSNVVTFVYFEEICLMKDESITREYYLNPSYDGSLAIYTVTCETYNELMGTNIVLENDEVLLYQSGKNPDIEVIRNLPEYENIVVKDEIESNIITDYLCVNPLIDNLYVMFVNDVDQYRTDTSTLCLHAFFDGDFDGGKTDFPEKLASAVRDYNAECKGSSLEWYESDYWYGSKSVFEDEIHGVYGGLMFVGIVLTIVFLGATVLLMYYRQVIEGYEDQARFKILRNVGMEKKDIHSSINSQILIVFLAPILLAGLHTVFALPFIAEFLKLQGMLDVPMMAKVALLTFVMFAVVYFLIYKLTSRAYYKIVNS